MYTTTSSTVAALLKMAMASQTVPVVPPETGDIRHYIMWTPAILPPHPSTKPTTSPIAQRVLAALYQDTNSSLNPLMPDIYQRAPKILEITKGEAIGRGQIHKRTLITNHKTDQSLSPAMEFDDKEVSSIHSKVEKDIDIHIRKSSQPFNAQHIIFNNNQNTNKSNSFFLELPTHQLIKKCDRMYNNNAINRDHIILDNSNLQTFNRYTKNKSNSKSLDFRTPNINFKEVKTTHSQKSFNFKEHGPCDQIFVFQKIPKYKKKLEKFKKVNKVKHDTKIIHFLKPIESSNKLQDKLQGSNVDVNSNKILEKFDDKFEKESLFYKNINKCSNNICKITNSLTDIENVETKQNLKKEPKNKFEFLNHNKFKDMKNIDNLYSQLSESLFVNTQNSETNKEEMNEQGFNECYSPLSQTFDVEDLFSLKNENLNTSLEEVSTHSYKSLSKEEKIKETYVDIGLKTQFDEKTKFEDSSIFNKYENNKALPTNHLEDCGVDHGYSENDVDIVLFEYPGKADSKTMEIEEPEPCSLKTADNRVKPDRSESNDVKKGNKYNSFEIDIGIINDRVVQMTSIRKPTLKQSTLFDYKKFFQSNVEPPNHPVNFQVSKETSDEFKKPKTPTKHSVHERKSSKLIKKVKDKLDNSKCCNMYGKYFSTDSVKSKNKSSIQLQQSSVKMDTAKRSSLQQKKKIQFVAPIKASHETSKDAQLKNYTLLVLDEPGADKLSARLEKQTPTKLAGTITFKEGYTLLNKPKEGSKNERCLPSGIMFLSEWESKDTLYYWLPLLDVNITKTRVPHVVDALLKSSTRVAVFEAQSVFLLLQEVLHINCKGAWPVEDPLVGCWLLDPDNPPKNFNEVVSQLGVDPGLLVVHPQADTKTQACDLLPVLEVATDLLHLRLTKTSLWTVFKEMEMKLIPILVAMETSNILVDVKKLHETAAIIDKILKQMEIEANKFAGHPLQINSHLQLRKVLFDELKLQEKHNLTIKQTEKGSKSTSQYVLEELKAYHPLPMLVLEYRRLQKVKSTYVDGLIQYVRADNTIGTMWEQVGAATGRITSKSPNLQAIPKAPIDLQEGRYINLRGVFKAKDGHSFLAADFQQIELRVFAHFTQDKNLLQAFHEDGDIFEQLAARWLNGAGPMKREKTKRIVYSMMYGAGPSKLAEYLNVDMEEASRIINNFVEIYPSLRSLPQSVISQCRHQGFLVTLSGRRRLFPHIRSANHKLRSYSERQAVNFLIQGSAVDVCKAAMLDCEAELSRHKLDAQLLLQIHDELVWEVPDHQLQETAETVRRAMELNCGWGERLLLLVPVPVCLTRGKTLANMDPVPNSF